MKHFKTLLLLLFLLNCVNPSAQAEWLGKYCNKGYAFGLVTSIISIQLWFQNQSLKQELQDARLNVSNMEIENSRVQNKTVQSLERFKNSANKGLQAISALKNIACNQRDLNVRIQRFKIEHDKHQQCVSNSVAKNKESNSNTNNNQSNSKISPLDLLKIENKSLKEELKTANRANKKLQDIIEKSIARQKENLPKD